MALSTPTNAGNEVKIRKASGGASIPREVLNKVLSRVCIRAQNSSKRCSRQGRDKNKGLSGVVSGPYIESELLNNQEEANV